MEESTDKNAPSPEHFARTVGTEVAQIHLVVKCLVRALLRQPSLDASSLLESLEKEGQQLTPPCDTAQQVIASIVADAKNYPP